MDSSNIFYYVSIKNYIPPAYNFLYTGTWNGTGTVTGSVPVPGLSMATPGFINFDVEVSPDGTTLYFNDGDFTGGGGVPSAADIVIAVDSSGGFIRDPNSAVTMANINTAGDLEYAPCISINGLELFFTRLDLGTSVSRIYRAIRSNITLPFGVPKKVSAIEGIVEGPALSPDEKSLYYHRMNTGTGLFEIYRVTRL